MAILFVNPALPVSFGEDNKSRRFLLSDVYIDYARGSTRDSGHTGGRNLSWTPPLLEKDNSKIIKISLQVLEVYNTQI